MIAGSIVLYKNDIEEVNTIIDSFFSGESDDYILYLIDNSPTDDLKKVASRMPGQIIYLFGHGNVGYGRGHNIAIKESIEKGIKYHVVLNADIEFGGDVLSKLTGFMDDNPNVGACIPDMMNPDGTRCYSAKLLQTPSTGIFRRFLKNSKKTEKMNYVFHLKFADHTKVFDVPNISGCFMFLRIDSLKEVGLFDERFFMYYEDVDLSRRVRAKYRICFYPGARAIHVGGKEAYHSKKMMKVMIKSAIQYFNKYHWFFDSETRRLNKETLRTVPRKEENKDEE